MTETERTIHDYIISEIMFDKDLPLEVGDSLLEGGVIDSMDLQRLIVFLEERFALEVADDLLVPENFESIRAVAGMISRLQAKD
jgi:acyl carrier protein